MMFKIAYSPIWSGVMGLGGMAVVTFFMLPQATESLWWWIGEVGGTLLLITGALVHGHLKWRRRQKFKKMVKDAGLEGRRVVDLGGNAIGVVPDGPAEWDKLRTRRG